MLVVQNPATSSPGLAFLLATIHEYGLEGWQDYWSQLGANGVEVVDGWTQAYYERFTWAGGGPTPMVVSYGSSPPAEVIFADPPRDDAPTGVIEDTCFRQVEFAGVLRGTDSPEAARQLVDFLVSERVPAGARPQPVRVSDEPGGRAAEGVRRLRRDARDLPLARPGRDRRRTVDLDRRVDGAGARVNRLPRWLLVALGDRPGRWGSWLFYVWPFVTLVVEAVTATAIADTLGRSSTWDVRLVHGVAGGGVDGGDDRRRPRTGLRRSPGSTSAAAPCSSACSRRCSCCRPS